jgi:hypothetical protein
VTSSERRLPSHRRNPRPYHYPRFKKTGSDCFRASSLISTSSCQLNSCGNNDVDGGDSKPDARCTNSMRDRSNSTNMVDKNSTAGCSRSTDNHSRLGIQSRLPQLPEFRRKSERQNSAQERKRIRLPPMQLKEAFSWLSLLFVSLSCLLFQRGLRRPMRGSPRRIETAPSPLFLLDSDRNRRAVAQNRKNPRSHSHETASLAFEPRQRFSTYENFRLIPLCLSATDTPPARFTGSLRRRI